MADRGKPVFDYSICMACGNCMYACGFDAIDMTKLGVDEFNHPYPALSKPENCIGCKQCEKQCPVDAIVVTTSAEGE